MKHIMILTITALSVLLLTGCNTEQTNNYTPAAVIGAGQEAPPAVNNNESGDISNLAAANDPDDSSVNNNRPRGFYFVYAGVRINLNDNMADVLAQIGEPNAMFESPSCAFDGVDRIFYFDGFIIDTFPLGDNDYVLSIVITDSSLLTPEGVGLGSSFDNMVAAYGNDYENMLDLFSYIKDGVRLSFLFEDDEIVDITYYFMLATS